jgi:hypothetical protein
LKLVPSFVISLAAMAGLSVAAGAQTPIPGSPVTFLDVPFIQQSEALCGGAAAAMVMRFWGATGVNAESFASIVDETAGGIRGEDLLRDLRSRGWDARSFRADRAVVTARLRQRQPVVALIEDRPGYFHFVVIVAWTNGRVVYHDPARAPFRVATETTFDAAWQKSDRWTMLLLPPATGVPAASATDGATTSPAKTPCDDLVSEGVRAAESGDRASAREIFTAAAELCPAASGPLREAAGLSALDGDWTEAERLAREAVSRDASDAHAWRIVATSAYLRGDPLAALTAWNRAGEPVIDLVTVAGLDRTRHAVATRLIALEPDQLLTTHALAAARRRLRDLPSADLASVSYKPLPGGRAAVEAVVVEQPVLPTTRGSLVSTSIHLLTDRELGVNVASPTGNGELFRGSWRWWKNRPRYEVAFQTPIRAGILSMAAFGEEQAYGGATTHTIEKRRGGQLSLSRWTSTMTRWEIGAGLDTWDGGDRTVNLSGSIDQRLDDDRLSIRPGAAVFAGDFDARAAQLAIGWRSATEHQGFVALGGVGWNGVTSSARRALWSGAGTGHGRDPLLRAHPLLEDGRIVGEVFGRTLVHGSAEVRRWMKPVLKVVRLAPAAFIDLAHANRRLSSGSAWHVDTGVGLRVTLPGSNVLRIDLGKGLRDGETALSFGWARW